TPSSPVLLKAREESSDVESEFAERSVCGMVEFRNAKFAVEISTSAPLWRMKPGSSLCSCQKRLTEFLAVSISTKETFEKEPNSTRRAGVSKMVARKSVLLARWGTILRT